MKQLRTVEQLEGACGVSAVDLGDSGFFAASSQILLSVSIASRLESFLKREPVRFCGTQDYVGGVLDNTVHQLQPELY